MNPNVKSALRWSLAVVGAFLAQKGYISADAQSSFAEQALAVAGGALSLASLFWSVRNNKHVGGLLRLALALPSDSTPDDMAEARSVMRFEETPQGREALTSTGARGWGDLVIRQAISTVISVVSDRVRRPKFERFLLPLRDALNAAFPAGGGRAA